jgi:hypothetical protein
MFSYKVPFGFAASINRDSANTLYTAQSVESIVENKPNLTWSPARTHGPLVPVCRLFLRFSHRANLGARPMLIYTGVAFKVATLPHLSLKAKNRSIGRLQ